MKKALSTCRFLVPCLGIVAAAMIFASVGCQQETKPTLYVYNWSDYIDPELVAEFEKLHGCVVKIDNFATNEDMFSKLQTGNDAYDIIIPTTYMIDELKRADMVQKIDISKIPNAKYVDPIVTKKLRDEKMEFSVPYLLGFTGIGYNAEQVGEEPASWTIFADEKFKGRMAMLEDMREVIAAGLIALGHNPNSRDESELAEARDLILKWRANLAKFGVDDIKDSLKDGQFYVVQQYSGDILQITVEDPNIRFTVPKEGAMFAADHFVIPKNSQNPDLAHKFIDFFCDPANCTRNMEYTQFLAPVPEAVKGISDELRNLPGFLLSAEDLENASVLEDMGDDLPKYSKIWDEIKSAK